MLNHHAYFYEGSATLLPMLGASACAEAGLPENSPDVSVRAYETFGIKESRALRDSAALRSVSGTRLFVVAATAMTTEAQQALLKLFEEPGEGSIFVLLVPHGTLLATLKSRCLPYPETLADEASAGDAKKFLAAPYKERTERIAVLLKDDSDEAKVRARDFLNALERELYAHASVKPSKELLTGLAAITELRGYLSDKAPSLKMIFEHLAAALPKI